MKPDIVKLIEEDKQTRTEVHRERRRTINTMDLDDKAFDVYLRFFGKGKDIVDVLNYVVELEERLLIERASRN